MSLTLNDFQYDLPEELIAQRPASRREDSRLMVLDRKKQTISHSSFSELAEWLPRDALLVINDARVTPVRLYGSRATGGQVEVFVLEPPPPGAEAGQYWLECLLRPAKRLKYGDIITFGPDLTAEFVRPGREGCRVLKFAFQEKPATAFEQYGRMPLPPYIKRSRDGDELKALDLERYQTVYARADGAVAAPTAGLHFSPNLLADLENRGIEVQPLTLLVGYGTFAPVREMDIARNKLHPEIVKIPAAVAEAVNRAKAGGRPVIAVGTTSVRSLEHAGQADLPLAPWEGRTELFIYPGFEFKVVDHLITNFHLPGSSLLMLVAAMTGLDMMREAYRLAVAEKYRFYSYGDAMLIL